MTSPAILSETCRGRAAAGAGAGGRAASRLEGQGAGGRWKLEAGRCKDSQMAGVQPSTRVVTGGTWTDKTDKARVSLK